MNFDSDQKILLTQTSKHGFAKVDHVEDDDNVDHVGHVDFVDHVDHVDQYLVLLRLTMLKMIRWSTCTLSTEKLNQNLRKRTFFFF